MESLTNDYVYPVDKMLSVSSDEKKRVTSLMKTLQSAIHACNPNKEASVKQLDAALTKFATFLAHEAETRHGIDQLCLFGILDQLVSRMCDSQLELVSEISYVDTNSRLSSLSNDFGSVDFFPLGFLFLKGFFQKWKPPITCANPNL